MAINDFEHQHQVAFFQLVEIKLLKKFPFLDKLLFAVPNGGQRSKSQGGKLKAEGVKRGVSDIILLHPQGNYGFLCIEMKHGKNKPDDEQRDFAIRVKMNGNGCYYVCYSSQEAMKCLQWYLNGATLNK